MPMTNTIPKKGTVRVWNGEVLVEYVDNTGEESSFVLRNKKDIQNLKEELEVAEEL